VFLVVVAAGGAASSSPTWGSPVLAGATSYVDRKPGKRPTYTVRCVNAAGPSADSARVAP